MGFLLIDFEGTQLSKEDRELLIHPTVAGVILFTRNYSNRTQLHLLTKALYATNPDLLVLVDQEGGRVQRFRDEFTLLPSMRYWGQSFQKNPVTTLQAFEQTINTMADELRQVGISANLMPVLDIDTADSFVIGERSFGSTYDLVSVLGLELLRYMQRNKMLAIAKHFPGHGAVHADSHYTMPVDERSLAELMANDFMPFKNLLPELDAIMPAHVIYPAVDAKYSAGFSSIWLQSILREQLGFKGVIMSDDITMHATVGYGNHIERAGLALEAGVDLVTSCNDRQTTIQVINEFAKYRNPKSEQRIINYIRKYK